MKGKEVNLTATVGLAILLCTSILLFANLPVEKPLYRSETFKGNLENPILRAP